MNRSSNTASDVAALDAMTGGAFSATTASERLARIHAWLETSPNHEVLLQVFKEISARDKGAAKPVKEKIDEHRRQKQQASLADEWSAKAQAMLASSKLNLADAMAWARDAAKAGAPLSREPLAGLRSALADRVTHIESLSHRAQVLRESSLLMAQRIDVLSTKAWTDAVLAQAGLQADLARFDEEWQALGQDPHWPSVDPKFPPMLQEASQHIHLVWDAFGAALTQTQAAANDPQLPLPAVPAWADQLKVLREALLPGLTTASPQATEVVDPEEAQAKAQAKAQARAQAVAKVTALVQSLETDLAQGHSKATSQEAAALRQALKTHAKAIPKELEATAQAALARAGELEGWQRWRADQLRESLVAKAEALLQAHPPAVTESASPDEAVAEPVWIPVITGRKLQETLRELREAWKQTDQGGQPNHALWKRFDQACNKAYPFVQAWLEKTKAETQAHRAQRQALLAEVAAWTQAHATDTDWKKQARELHAFSERWRGSGHVSEKVFAELQTQWKAAMSAAHAGLEQAQKASIEQRRQMIEEAKQWANAPVLKVDAIKALQQRWQSESQAVPLDRKQAQKLWDAFRLPLDEAFARKSQARTQHAQALSAHDQQVMQAAEQLEAAVAKGDAMAIREAMQQLSQAASQPIQAQEAAAPKTAPEPAAAAAASDTAADTASDADTDAATDTATEPPTKAVAPKPVKKLIAVRGDDRPGQKKTEVAAPVRGGKPGMGRPDRGREGSGAMGARHFREDARPSLADRGPRLGDAAFRAQRQALEHAQAALKKLAMQAHGEVLVHVLSAWQHRQADQLPAAKELGPRLTPVQRQAWVKALQTPAQGDALVALLRLEMAADVNTPAEHIAARRQWQLQWLTQRHEAPPAQTWPSDVATVLQSSHEDSAAQRLQNALRVLMRR